ncbi:hypothetical protein PG990_006165 [Apiospora arundinis]|uniref:C2H2-type zinc-finger transcription factor orf8 n=1 Tax=Apiospora arundinis TaxID=335852 RepID=A0ABR2JAY3_9PEZI
MDPSRQDQVSDENLYLPNNSQNYLTTSNTPGHLLFDYDRPVTSRRTHPEDRISPASHYSAPASPTSVPSRPPSLPSSNFFRLSSDLDKQSRFTSAPSLRVHPAPEHGIYTPHSSRSTTADMSTVAVHYDSRFEMGVPRSTYSWPDQGGDLLGHDLGSVGHGSDISLTPPSTSRSVTGSPPRGTLTPEQRELKRQRDLARRDSKASIRARRGMSGSYSSHSPPVSMNDFPQSSAMPVYTTSSSQISLLAEPVTTVSATGYIPSYSSPLPEPNHSMFSSNFSSLPSNAYMSMDYPTAYPQASSSHSVNSHYETARPSSMNDSHMLYPVPHVLSSGSSPSHEGHVRVVQSRPKPQCWEHGCNGRQFSTFSNLLRHQREKSGQAAKAVCPNCGAEFTRTTARNGHLAHDKCKQRRNS